MAAAELAHFCPRCGERFAASGFCPTDGSALGARSPGGLLGAQLGNYVVVALIGAGGMGEVYRAIQPRIGARVAIKVLGPGAARDPETVRRFFAEAQAVNRVRHDHIVAVLDVGETDGRPYLVMEELEGAPLSALIKQLGPLPLGSVGKVALDVLSALEAAHAQGIVHRDLKPHNIFVTTTGRTVVLDFGVAKLLDARPTDAAQTRSGVLLGTPTYMAPEQIRSLPVDGRADLYSLGVVLFEGCTGVRPFHSESLFDLLEQHVDQPPPSPRGLRPDLPVELEAVILTALGKSPDQRFASARAMASALESSLGALPASAWSTFELRAAARAAFEQAHAIVSSNRDDDPTALQTAAASPRARPERGAPAERGPEPERSPRPRPGTDSAPRRVTSPTVAMAPTAIGPARADARAPDPPPAAPRARGHSRRWLGLGLLGLGVGLGAIGAGLLRRGDDGAAPPATPGARVAARARDAGPPPGDGLAAIGTPPPKRAIDAGATGEPRPVGRDKGPVVSDNHPTVQPHPEHPLTGAAPDGGPGTGAPEVQPHAADLGPDPHDPGVTWRTNAAGDRIRCTGKGLGEECADPGEGQWRTATDGTRVPCFGTGCFDDFNRLHPAKAQASKDPLPVDHALALPANPSRFHADRYLATARAEVRALVPDAELTGFNIFNLAADGTLDLTADGSISYMFTSPSHARGGDCTISLNLRQSTATITSGGCLSGYFRPPHCSLAKLYARVVATYHPSKAATGNFIQYLEGSWLVSVFPQELSDKLMKDYCP